MSESASRLVRLAVLAWAGGAALIAAASWSAFFIPPLDLLNQIAPFWLLLAILGSLAVLALPQAYTHRLARAGFGVALLAQGALLAPELLRPIPVATEANEAPHVRIVWLNTQSGSSPAGVTDYLINSGADFVMLAEYHPWRNAIPEELRAAYPYFAACREPDACNVVILSRREPVAQRDFDAESASGLRMVWADFEIDGAPLRLVATHLNRPYPAERQARERSDLATRISDASPDDTILAGDFNATPWSFALLSFDRASGLTRHDRAIATWPAAAWTRLRLPAPVAFMALDHVYSGANWRLVQIRRGPRTGADHYPIEAEFVWVAEH
jgi:endonuclease/exonuclease/phosphatase (EEP) superfamily protein YafD